MCKLYILNQIARASLGNVLQFMPVAKAAIQVGAVSPLTILDALTRNLQNVKHKHAGQPDQKRVASYRIHVSLWLVTAHFQKWMHMHCYRAHRVIKVLMLWS